MLYNTSAQTFSPFNGIFKPLKLNFLQRGETRLRHKEFVFPVVVGTCAFYLGKKVNKLVIMPRSMLQLVIRVKTAHRQCSCMQATETQSHKWYLYLRGINNEDIGHVVKKVSVRLVHAMHASMSSWIVQGTLKAQPFTEAPSFTEDIMQAIFNLHPTFPIPQREVTAPPFEIEEHGWGEFEVNVVVSDLSATIP